MNDYMSVVDPESVRNAANILLAKAGERSLLESCRGSRGSGFIFTTSTYTLAVVVVGINPGDQPVIRSILKIVDRNRDYSWSDKGLPGPYTKVILMVNSSPIYPQAGE